MFLIRMGIPEMDLLWKELSGKADDRTLTGSESKLFKKLIRCLHHLRENPRHPGLQSHEIEPLSRRYGFRIWQSYLENNTPAAGRLFWTYGPQRGEISILGLEPHPEDQKRGSYDRVALSALPPLK